MKSMLTVDTLIDTYIAAQFNANGAWSRCKTDRWDCQDTECNNETECYFYYPSALAKETAASIAADLCMMLGVDESAYALEFDESTDKWRVQVVCTVTVCRNGGYVPLVPAK